MVASHFKSIYCTKSDSIYAICWHIYLPMKKEKKKKKELIFKALLKS